jgi:hypothetical protein
MRAPGRVFHIIIDAWRSGFDLGSENASSILVAAGGYG